VAARATILGLGQWVPDAIRGNDAWPPAFAAAHAARVEEELTHVQANAEGDRIDRLVARYALAEAGDPFLGATRRRVAEASVTASDAETCAARAALDDAGVAACDVDVVLSSSAVPDRIVPPTAASVAHALGADRAWAAGVDAVCASTVVALEVALALVESGRARFVLLTQSHLMTRAFPAMHPASPNVGDASTALLVGPTDRGGLLASRIVTHGEFADAVVWRRPRDADTKWWEAGGAMTMGSYAPTTARKLVRDTVRIGAATVGELLDRGATGAGRVAVLAAVQPRGWVPRAIAEAAGIDPACAVETFDERAHLGACGVVVNLLAARRDGRLDAGARVVLYGQGAGFTIAGALLEWS
jgi:3-oxoacyl-[acyl-carrier-protein] synthase III